MSDGAGRVIRKEDHGVSVEWQPVEESAPIQEKFTEVRLLPNGWVECQSEEEDENRTVFFPPDRANEIVVHDEDEREVPSTW